MSKYALINATILDGTKDMKPLCGKMVLIENERITSIVDNDPTIKGYDIIDLEGKYLLPGLINLHAHLPISGKPSKVKMDPKKIVKFMTATKMMRDITYRMTRDSAQLELESGVTTVRAVGGILDLETKLRNNIKNGTEVGPRILTANQAVTCRGGHMEGSVAIGADTKEEIEKEIKRLYEEDVDLIKLMITGGVLDATEVGVPGKLLMSPEQVKIACDAAHKYGLKVAAHCEGVEGVKVGLKYGVDSIEHGAMPDEEMAEYFNNGTSWLCATFSPVLPFVMFDPEISKVDEVGRYNGEVLFKGMIECVKYCLKHNIPVGLGNDVGCPFVTHYDYWRELCYFKKYAEVTNAFALYTATLNNANLIGLGDQIGSIEENKLADLIVVSNNPLDDLKALRNVDLVFTNGKLIIPKYTKDQFIEKQLNRYL